MTDAFVSPGNPLGASVDGTAPDRIEMPPLSLDRMSYNGLITLGGEIFEEYQWELRWPYSMETYKKMAKDETIAPALNLVEMAISRVPWTIEIPKGYEDKLQDEKKFLQEVMNDMEHTWGSFIRQAASFNRYGFSAHEKVFRKRLKKNGSKYNDGRIGLRSLPIITQDSIASWQWDEETGTRVTGLLQWKNKPAGLRQLVIMTPGQYVPIPREKYVLFRNNPLKDDPSGTSPLQCVWRAWKYKAALQEAEAMGVAQDCTGLKVLYIPPRYMDPQASDDDKAVYAYYQKIMRNLHQNEQSGLILPQVLDEKGEQYFKFELMSMTGKKAFNISDIIKRYEKDIITALMASQMILGQDGGGSFALSESLNQISEMAIESRLRELEEQLNHDLIPQLFSLNGMDTAVTPVFKFGAVSQPSIDDIGKYIQRCGAVGMLSDTPRSVNWIAEQVGLPIPFDDEDISQEEAREKLVGFTSNAAQGMEEGMPGGVGSATGGSGDSSTSNSENV